MSTLAEIEAAADALSVLETEKLLGFLTEKLRRNRALPEPRIYTDAEVAVMLAEDEADGKHFRAGN